MVFLCFLHSPFERGEGFRPNQNPSVGYSILVRDVNEMCVHETVCVLQGAIDLNSLQGLHGTAPQVQLEAEMP